MTITLSETLIINQVDKIILPRSNIYHYTIIRKKTLAAHALPRHSQASPPLANAFLLYECAEAQPVIFLDSQLGLILMQSTLTINNSQMDFQHAFPRSP